MVVFIQLLRCRVHGEFNLMRAAGKHGRGHDYNGRLQSISQMRQGVRSDLKELAHVIVGDGKCERYRVGWRPRGS